jgi:2-methylcitrate dehydratase PrpD
MSAQSGKRSEVHPDRLTEHLAAFVAGARERVLPDAVEHRARIVVLDTLGAILLGATLPAGRIVADTFGPRSAAGGATLIGHGRKAEPGIAAYVNGLQAHADEVDDSHFASLTHPASTSLPGLLALAQVRGLSATEVFQGLSAAYDVQCRVSLAFDPTQLQNRGIMPLAVCGVYGSVASAAFALALDTEATTTAFGLAGLQSAGYWACATDGSHMSKAMMSAFPARNGVESAWLASAGFLGPLRVLEGRDGILGALSDAPRPAELTRELGERFEILGTSIKKHVSGGPIRGAVDGLFLILDKYAVRTQDIETIRVDLAGSAVAIVDNRDNPPINLQHVVAVGALDRIVGLEQHTPARVTAADTLAMKARVQLFPDDEFEKVWPGERPARVTVTLADGTVHTELVWNASGSPESPLTWSEVESKFLTITGRFLDEAVARDIADTVSSMHTADEFASLMSTVGSIRLEAGGHHS